MPVERFDGQLLAALHRAFDNVQYGDVLGVARHHVVALLDKGANRQPPVLVDAARWRSPLTCSTVPSGSTSMVACGLLSASRTE